jgi:DNA-binding MarR family transcriptional regulator
MKRSPKAELASDTEIVINAIRRIVHALRKASKLTEKNMGLSAAQLFVLQRIAESEAPLSINDLAKRTLTHQSSVSVVVTRLVEQGLIERVKSKSDGRAVELCINKKGSALLQKAAPSIQEQILVGVSRLSDDERRGLVADLEKYKASLFFESHRGKGKQ